MFEGVLYIHSHTLHIHLYTYSMINKWEYFISFARNLILQ